MRGRCRLLTLRTGGTRRFCNRGKCLKFRLVGSLLKRMAVFLAGTVLMFGFHAGAQPLSANPATGAPFVSDYEFTFARMIYQGLDLEGWGPRWSVDWPSAEQHLLAGVRRLTRINADREGVVLDIMDDKLFDYPWLYVVEAGALALDPARIARLREYLLRGGFLMVDDFHGPYQWDNFAHVMRRVFPDRTIVDLKDHNEVFHVLYNLPERMQIPGLQPLRQGRTWEHGGNTPHWRGIHDDQGRLMVVINFNMDLGDAWEHADWPEYPEPYSAMAYRFALNYIVYAFTH